MRYRLRRVIVALAVLCGALASTASAQVRLGTHAVRGRVESISATALVIRLATIERTEMRFVLNASTEREGRIVTGDAVSIRYVTSGDAMIATAVASETRGCKVPSHAS